MVDMFDKRFAPGLMKLVEALPNEHTLNQLTNRRIYRDDKITIRVEKQLGAPLTITVQVPVGKEMQLVYRHSEPFGEKPSTARYGAWMDHCKALWQQAMQEHYGPIDDAATSADADE